MRVKVRQALAALLALTLLGGLTACTAIPDSGPVREGLQTLDQVDANVQFNPNRPAPGASQEDIVRGFVRAASSSNNDYEIAREFLAPGYAAAWDPWLSVLVEEGAQQYRSESDNLAVLSLETAASVDARGHFTRAAQGGSTDVQFELQKVQGEWRITSAPAGIILSKATFIELWVPKVLYYVSADGRLVAEPRWFLNQSTLSTQIVRELIAGPGEQLLEVAHTAFPSGTTLTTETVPVHNGVATIDLSPEFFNADAQGRDLVGQQIAASLQSVPGVSKYVISVNGTVVDEGSVTIHEDVAAADRQFAALMRNGEFGVSAAGEMRSIEGVSEQVAALKPKAVSLSIDRTTAVVLHTGGASLVKNNRSYPIATGKNLLVPSIDPLGYAWIYDKKHPLQITATTADGTSHVFDVPWLAGYKVVASRVSLGGNRLGLLVRDGEFSTVLVLGIIRDEQAAPIGLSAIYSSEFSTAGKAIDLDWLNDYRFVVLSDTIAQSNAGKVSIGGVGLFTEQSGAVAGGQVVSGGSRTLLRVLDDDGDLFVAQGSGWQSQLSGVELLAKAG